MLRTEQCSALCDKPGTMQDHIFAVHYFYSTSSLAWTAAALWV